MIFSESAPDIWSLSRKYRRSFCPRSAILRYREAPRAREEDASEIAVRAYACGKKISDSKFLREIMLGVLRREFYAGETDPARLDGVVSEAFHLEYRKLIYGRSDRQLFSLCREPDFEGKCRELEHLLTTYLNNIRPHWAQLLAVPPEARRSIVRVLDLNISRWRCFGSPLCAYFECGKLCFVELRGGDFSGDEPETAMLHRVYALNFCSRDPGSVESMVLDYHNGTMRIFNSGNDISRAVKSVKDELARWEELWEMDYRDIPGNEVNCPRCVFAEICKTNARK